MIILFILLGLMIGLFHLGSEEKDIPTRIYIGRILSPCLRS